MKVGNISLTISEVPVGDSIKVGDLVGFDTDAHTLVRASGSSLGVVPAVGVAAASYQSGDLGSFHVCGEITGFSNLTVGAVQYLSVSSAGGVQASVPAGAGNLKQEIGRAVGADRIMVKIEPGTVL